MGFRLSDQQRDIQRTMRELVAVRSPEAEVRRVMDTERGHDPKLWTELGELGIPGVAVPEQYGGLGLGQRELALVCEEMGRALMCSPLFASVVLAANVVLVADDPAAMDALLPGIADGSRTATLAVYETATLDPATSPRTTATPAGGGWTVDGAKTFVIDGATADTVILLAQADAGPTLFMVTRDDSVEATPLRTLDLTRKQAALRFRASRATAIGEPGQGWETLTAGLDRALVGLAAEQVGGMRYLLGAAVEHVTLREQFDRPIGSFQAVKHRCAEMAIQLRCAEAVLENGVAAADLCPRERALAGSLAKVCCSEAYFWTAAEALHLRGGNGFTWENPAHLYFRRAKSSQLLFGTPTEHRERLVRLGALAVAAEPREVVHA